VDYLAVSFPRSAADMQEAAENHLIPFLRRLGSDGAPSESTWRVPGMRSRPAVCCPRSLI
jgi:hypothetical protein